MHPYVLAVTGASAQPLAERTLQLLLKAGRSVHLVLSKGAYAVFKAEQGLTIPVEPNRQAVFWRERLDCPGGDLVCHRWNDQSVSIASGSFRTKAMLIVPCSMGTVGRINAGVAMDLIERCADVHLKEGRPLLIAPREMPFSLIHLRNLTALAEAGARIAAPIPAWYTQPTTIDDMIDFLVIRLLDGLEDDLAPLQRWTGPIR
ncbi:MAG: UbiX family flavin prenyltransferase [Cyanobacteria bacterium]|nr:UbiX family flavin prenyltransferase [Synechococcus sp. BS307-5m-G38]MDA0257574.1 UbiX family flavin prenyltransferase [Cyanobacteriota bacterium]